MKFCDRCGSRMERTPEGFRCRKCGYIVHADAEKLPKNVTKVKHSNSVHVVDKPRDEYVKVSRKCPKCGNGKAYRWISRISGEHAGVRRERTVEHFRCTRCSYSWSESY